VSRFLYWSIYGGGLLLSGVLIAASLMAVLGFVPFRSAQPVLASAAGRESRSAGFPGSPSNGFTPADEAQPADEGGWEAVWQASSQSADADSRGNTAPDDSVHVNGSLQVNLAGEDPPAGPDDAVDRAEQTRPDRSRPQPPVTPREDRPADTPDRPVPDPTFGAPPVVAGLWPVIQPNPQLDPAIDDPTDDSGMDEPADDGGDTGGGDEGGADRDPHDGAPSNGPLRLTLVPSHDEVSAGEIVSVQVVLSEADKISSVPFHVRFNDEVLEYVGAKSGPALAGRSVQPILLASVDPARPDDLAVGLALVRSSGRFSGSGTVVVLDFRALQAGQSDLTLEKASVRDANSRPLTVQIESSVLAVR
jgi:hypothetical protein